MPIVEQRLRVVWFCTPFGWPGGGTQRHLTNWANFIDAKRYAVTLVLGGPDRAQLALAQQHFEAIGPLRVVTLSGLSPLSGWLAGGLRALRACLRQLSPDILHTIFIQSDIAAGLVRRQSGVPIRISSLEGPLTLPTFVSPFRRILYRLAYRAIRRRLDAIIAISRATQDAAVRDYGAPHEKMTVIHSGVDAREFQRKDGWPYTDAEPPRTVGLISRLSPEKNPSTFIAAMPHVLRRCPQTRFVVAGDGSEATRLETLARQLGVAERVSFIGWTDKVAEALRVLDVFVFASQLEGLPWAVLGRVCKG